MGGTYTIEGDFSGCLCPNICFAVSADYTYNILMKIQAKFGNLTSHHPDEPQNNNLQMSRRNVSSLHKFPLQVGHVIPNQIFGLQATRQGNDDLQMTVI